MAELVPVSTVLHLNTCSIPYRYTVQYTLYCTCNVVIALHPEGTGTRYLPIGYTGEKIEVPVREEFRVQENCWYVELLVHVEFLVHVGELLVHVGELLLHGG